jgi:hypothetical protein
MVRISSSKILFKSGKLFGFSPCLFHPNFAIADCVRLNKKLEVQYPNVTVLQLLSTFRVIVLVGFTEALKPSAGR